MASLFWARRGEGERGAGGKIPRGRCASRASASPYARPAPASPAQSRSPKWLSGLIFTAGKLISSVFSSDSDKSSQPSSSYSRESSDGASSGDSSNEDEENLRANEELNQFVHDQRRNKPEILRNGTEESLAMMPKSDIKIAIEQLLMQEIFSRDECNKLTKIIQSRVVDFPPAEIDDAGREGDLPNRNTGSVTVFTGAWQSVNKSRKLPETIFSFASNFGALSPGSPLQEWTPDLRDKAVTEAKKYLEEKKMELCSKSALDCGPCSLNTSMLHYDIEGVVGSPVDMAKSYMQSLPPWRSRSSSSTGFKSPPPTAMQLYKDGFSNYSLPSSKVLKRNYVAIGSHDELDETRRVRLKSTDNILQVSKFKQVGSSAELPENKTFEFSSASDKKEFCVEDRFGAFVLDGQKGIGIMHPLEADKITSSDIVAEPEEAVQAMEHKHESLVLATNSLEPTPEKGSETKLSDADVLILEKNQKDVQDFSQLEERGGSISDPHVSPVQASTLSKHDGDNLSETKVSQSENMKSMAPRDHDDATNQATNCDSDISSWDKGLLQAKKSSHLSIGPFSDDSLSRDGNFQMQKEANGSTNKIIANGSLVELGTDLHFASLNKGEADATNSSISEPAAGNAGESRELLNEATNDVPATNGTGSFTDKLQNGTTMSSIERMLAEPRPKTTRRGRKQAVKSKRGRGKLM